MKSMPSKIRLALMAGCAVVALAPAMASAQEQAIVAFDIPAQDLDGALTRFGQQSGREIIISAALTRNRRAPAVQGKLAPEDALRFLLADSGLIYRVSSSGSIVVEASDPQSGSAAGDGADGTVQALIVTAQKREEDIQDVPIAISAFTQEDLTRSQVAGGADLMTQVPNMTFTKTNFSGYSIQIRGIGTQAISATTDPAVAVAFNNTPFIRNRFFEQEFYDLERVEVLRGPQGTLYGRNATAGVVNIISAKAKPQFAAKLSADVANYGSSRLEGMINLPLVEDKAALRIAGAWTRRDGFVKNILGDEQTDGRDLWSSRVTLTLKPTDNFTANLIYEHFEENDDRLRSGKQMCNRDAGPAEVNGHPVIQSGNPVFAGPYARIFWTQGCRPASLYSPDSFQVPNGFALPYGSAAGLVYAPINPDADIFDSTTQSHDLREIETRIKPEYSASTNTVELQMQFDLPGNLTLASETGYNRDHIFSFEDYNRFSTRAGVLLDTSVSPGGVYCDPQLGCSDRMLAADLSTARSRQFSQELRLSSDYEGPFNFSLGANFLRYQTEDKYYVFFNTLSAAMEYGVAYLGQGDDGRGPFLDCFIRETNSDSDFGGYAWSNPEHGAAAVGCGVVDFNDIHHLNDQGRNYFLSKNPYNLLSYAAFGEAYWQITPQLKLTAGARWTVDRKTAPEIPSWLLSSGTYGLPTLRTSKQEWREPTGRLAIDWQPALSFTDETLLYASYVRGYKAGGANPPTYIVTGVATNSDFGGVQRETQLHPRTFAPEFVDAYEIGTKNTLLDGRLTFNLNAFYYDYTGYQISQIIDRSAVNSNFDAKVWGSELEVDWRPLDNLRLGFKGGYENTRIADGQSAIDVMDRTAGTPGWLVERPFPTVASNCIIPEQYAGYQFSLNDNSYDGCFIYLVPDQLPFTAPNKGEGFSKDLSGNELPNAPHYTATVTADYTVPLPSDWLMTLHTDLYYQSEAWTRVFNTEGYDKLKAYSNINLAAIFTNEDAGWTVMAYIKNVLDKDNITGAFLNSDDSGLTTNVFLNEPRLYGLRVTKNWNGSAWWSAHANTSGHYPYRLELDGAYGRVSGGKEILIPAGVALFPAEHPYPLGVQNDLDWGSVGGVKFTYQPDPKGWAFSTGVRYGRASGNAEGHDKWETPGGYRFSEETTDIFKQKYPDFPADYWKKSTVFYLNPTNSNLYSYATAAAESEETHAIVDFMVGKDVGLGSWASRVVPTMNFGLRYAHFNSDSSALMHGRPDLDFPDWGFGKYGAHMHRFHAIMDAHRQFDGAGPAVNWDAEVKLAGDSKAEGQVGLDVGVGGSILYGRQTTESSGQRFGGYTIGMFQFYTYGGPRHDVDVYTTPLNYKRSNSATVPSLNANLGLTYTLGGLKVSGGYRIERYFDAIDGGIAERKTYDRQFDGPYFKVSVGFGG